MLCLKYLSTFRNGWGKFWSIVPNIEYMLFMQDINFHVFNSSHERCLFPFAFRLRERKKWVLSHLIVRQLVDICQVDEMRLTKSHSTIERPNALGHLRGPLHLRITGIVGKLIFDQMSRNQKGRYDASSCSFPRILALSIFYFAKLISLQKVQMHQKQMSSIKAGKVYLFIFAQSMHIKLASPQAAQLRLFYRKICSVEPP